MTETFSTKEAIAYVVENFNVPSMYALAKALSDETLVVQTVQISNYLKGKKMSQRVADRFFDTYGVIVNDAHKPGVFQR